MWKSRAAPAGGQAGTAGFATGLEISAVIICYAEVLPGEEDLAKCALCSGLHLLILGKDAVF